MARTLIATVKDQPRNLLINGAFDFWQRGTGPLQLTTTPTNFLADRFVMEERGTAPTEVIAEQSTDVPLGENFQYSLRTYGGPTADNDLHYIAQKIEADNIIPYIGKTVTFSAWAKATFTGIANVLYIQAQTNALSKDVWDGSHIYANVTPVPDASLIVFPDGQWHRYSLSFEVPQEAENGMLIWMRTSTSGTINAGDEMFTTGWMLHEGPVSKGFERAGKTIGEELILCQRYYEKSYRLDIAPGTDVTDVNGFGVVPGIDGSFEGSINHLGNQIGCLSFNTVKRVAPTIGAWGWDGLGGGALAVPASTQRSVQNTRSVGGTPGSDPNYTYVSMGTTSIKPSETGFKLNTGTWSAGLAGYGFAFHWAADAEL